MVLKEGAMIDPNEQKTIQFKISAKDWFALKTFASERRYNGRKVGASHFAKLIILDYLNKKIHRD